ncbi:MAG: O-antigen ligase family protein [Planctomycetaceae bacterium]
MGLQSAFFLTAFAVLIVAAVVNPFWGIVAYMAHYYVWPEKQWWGELLASAQVRVSLTIGVVTIVSTVAHWARLRERLVGPLLHSQEVLFWSYIAVIGLTEIWGLPPDPIFQPSIHPLDKMLKIGIFSFMLTHIVTTKLDLERFLWFMLIVGGAYLGYLAYMLPASHFVKGRLEGVGGPDFSDSNFAAAHFVVMGILGAMLLLKSRTWSSRLICLVSGGLIANGLILTRSRGAFLGVIAAGAAAVVLVDRNIRKHLLWAVPVVAIGCYSLTDDLFWERIFTMFVTPEELDASAESRLEFWKVATQIFFDHPLGIGPGRFFGVIGDYQPEYAGRDAHSLYFRTLAELGIFGVATLLALIGNAFWVLRRCKKKAHNLLYSPDLISTAIGLQLMIIAFVTAGLTMTMTYSEELFLVLLLPACLERAVDYAVVTNLRTNPLSGQVAFGGGPLHLPGEMHHGHPATLRV